MKMKTLESDCFIVTMGDDQICRSIVKEGADVSLKDARRATEMVKDVSEGERYPLLVDIRKIKSISKDARDHFSMNGREPGITAIGLYVKSPVSKLIGNFFLGLNRSVVPVKIFTREEQALKWLKKFL